MLALLAALRAKVMGLMDWDPRVALFESGNPGLHSSTPLVSSVCRASRGKHPLGGNILFDDGHVAWRDFSDMQMRFSTYCPNGIVQWSF
jgi:prepilin-type processing-associated H-X9-DG protein